MKNKGVAAAGFVTSIKGMQKYKNLYFKSWTTSSNNDNNYTLVKKTFLGRQILTFIWNEKNGNEYIVTCVTAVVIIVSLRYTIFGIYIFVYLWPSSIISLSHFHHSFSNCYSVLQCLSFQYLIKDQCLFHPIKFASHHQLIMLYFQHPFPGNCQLIWL